MARAALSRRLRRSPHLVSYWEREQLVVHNYATGLSAGLSTRAWQALAFFDDWRTPREFASRAAVPMTAARNLLASLVKATLLQSSGRRSSRESAMERWSTWNPAAGFFHMATRDVRYIDPVEGDRLLRRKARHQPLPSPIKTYRGSRTHDLPRVPADGEFPRVLLERRTWRQFSRRPLSLPALSGLLGLTGGIHHWASLRGQGVLPLKTSPSGGARHPIELYVCARRVDGLRPGLYHYAPDRHRLELVRRQPRAVRVQRYINRQYWYEGAAALVFFTAVFERYQWKYTSARAYRATLIEAGHQCQTFCLVATWLGLAPFCSMALADSQIEQDLGLDGISESVLYAAGVGTRPPGSSWGSKPAGSPPLRVRSNTHILAQHEHKARPR